MMSSKRSEPEGLSSGRWLHIQVWYRILLHAEITIQGFHKRSKHTTFELF